MATGVWRSASFILGIVTSVLGMYGAYTFGLKLEGGVSYLTIAAPVIAGAAAIIPPLAEHAWRNGQYGKSLLWWLILIPAALTVFFGAFERVHVAKAGALAERQALRNVSDRASKDLLDAKRIAAEAEAKARKAEARKTCNASCREAQAGRSDAQAKLAKAEQALLHAETKATTEASLKAPEWLLPASLDLLAFMAIWTGLSGPRAAAEPRKRRASRPAPKKNAKAKARKPKATPLVHPTDADAIRALRVVK